MSDAMSSDPAARAACHRIGGVCLALAMALAACGDDDVTRDAHPDAADTLETDSDSHNVDVDDGLDTTAPTDTQPDIAPPIDSVWRVDARLVPPSGAPAADAGWVALNRFGRRLVTDETFTVDVAKDGLTLTLLLPPGTPSDATPSPLLVATVSRPEDPAPTLVTVDATSTALALLLLDPRATSPDPERLLAFLRIARQTPATLALADELGASWGDRAWTAAPSVLGRFDTALDAVLAAVTPLADPFERTPVDLPPASGLDVLTRHGPGLLRVDLDPSGALRVAPLPLVPGVLEVTVSRATSMVGSRDALIGGALVDPTLIATLRLANGAPGVAPSASIPVPTDAVLDLVATLGESPANLRAAAAELIAALAPGLACPMPSDANALPGDLVGLDCTLPADVGTEAGRRLVGLARPLVARAAARDGAARTLDPSSAWSTEGATRTQRMLVAVGDPFTPRVTVASSPVVAPGDAVELRGVALDLPASASPDPTGATPRVTFVDAFGHARAPTAETPLPATAERRAGLRVLVPPGLAGALTVRVESADARFETAGPRVRPRATRLTPSVVRPGAGVTRVRVDGAGFAPDLTFAIGPKSFSIPPTARPDSFTITLDPAALGPGVHALGFPDVGGPTLTVASLGVVDAPTTIARGATLTVKLRGLDPLADTLTVRAGATPLAVRLLARDPGDPVGVARALIDTAPLPAGGFAISLATPDAAVTTDLVVTDQTPLWTRTTTFHASDAGWRAVDFARALEIADGTLVPYGDFTFLDTSVIVSGGWYCPLKITPADQVVPATCNHFTRVCNDSWIWDTVTDESRWLLTSRPPGRASSGAHCDPKIVAGPSSWSGVPTRDIDDLVSSFDTVSLAGATLRGPEARLTLPFARGGGLAVRAPLGGGRSDVTLDLDVADATSNADYPVVLLSGVTGVRIARLVVNGRVQGGVGACKTALRIEGSRDVQIDELLVRNCDTAIEVSGSSDVRIGAPRALGSGSKGVGAVTVLGAKTAISIVGSDDVFGAVRVGAYTDSDFPNDIELGLRGTDGVVIHDSRRVRLSGEIGRTSGDAVRVSASTSIVLGPLELGFVRRPSTAARPEGLPTWAAGAGDLAVGTGIRVVGSTDVRVLDTTVMQAGDAVRLDGGGLVLRRVALGGIDDGVGAAALPTLPPANARGLVVTGVVDLDAEDLVVGRNAEVGVDVMDASGRVRVAELATASRGGVVGGQRCGVRAQRSRDLLLEGATSTGDVVGLCFVDVTDVVVDGFDASGGVLGLDADGMERALLRDMSIGGKAGVRLLRASAVDLEDATLDAGLASSIVPNDLEAVTAVALHLEGTGPSADPIGLSRIEATASGAPAIEARDLGTPALMSSVLATSTEAALSISSSLPAVTSLRAADLTLDGVGDAKAPRLSLAGSTAVVVEGAEIRGSVFLDGARGGLVLRSATADAIGLTGHSRMVSSGVEAAVEVLGTTAPRVAITEHVGPIRVSGCARGPDLEGVIAIAGARGKITLTDCDASIRIDDARDAAATTTLQHVAGASIDTLAGPLILDGGSAHRVARAPSVALSAGASGVRLVEAQPTSAEGLPRAVGTLASFTQDETTMTAARLEAPDHALVEAWSDTGVMVARAFALGGHARLVFASASAPTFRVTTPDGQSGPREAIAAPVAACLPPAAPAIDLARASEARLTAETLDGWIDVATNVALPPEHVEVARCGPTSAFVTLDGAPPSPALWLDDGTTVLVPLALAAATAMNPRDLAWSADCARLAFIADVDLHPDLFMVDVATRVVTRLTADAATDATPAWLVDDTLVLSRATAPDPAALYRVDPLAAAPTPEPFLAIAQAALEPAPSPDGLALAFTRCAPEAGACSVALTGLDGRGWMELGPAGCESRSPVWLGGDTAHTAPILAWLQGEPDGGLAVVAASSGGTARGRLGTTTASRLRVDARAGR